MKFILKVLLFLCAFVGTGRVVAQNNVVDEIVWVVGDEAILKSDVENYRKQMLMDRQRIEGDPYCFIPEQLAVNKLFLDQAKIDSIEVQESNVNRMLEYYVSEYTASAGSVEKLEEYYGKKLKEIRSDLRTQIREDQLINGARDKITGTVTLAPSEIRKFYNGIPQDSLPFIPTTLELQIITAEPKIPLAEIDAVKARLRQYTDEITSGKSQFSTLALLHSEDQGSALKGGELGFRTRVGLLPEFANVAFALTDPAKVSNIVESEYGYHIIQLIERRGDMANFRHILLKPKVMPEELDKAKHHLDTIREKILDKDFLFEGKEFTFDIAATFLSADKDTRNNKGIMANQSDRSRNSGTARFNLDELEGNIAKVVGEMKAGEISQPFTMINDKGKEVAAIVKVTNRIEGHKANLSTDYQIVKMMAENQKRQRILDEWLQKKIKTTYVRIDPEWKGCDFKYKGWVK
ncbi:MAG: peptidylprolyl isomerase [Dysgonamonadaceae bacterium]|jgi:peptidyl-prolyl cis-trans isomerase SurA|nr:peptidylprolyl isomerase [Dysgonamonadaceae bacterium]